MVISVAGGDARAKLNQYGNYIESILAAYKPTVLKNNSHDNMARLFGRILSPITKPQPKTCNNSIANLVTVDDVEFLRDGIIRYISGGAQTFAAALSFKVAPDYLDEEFYDTVSTIQTEMITMNGFGIMGAADVESVIRQRRSTTEEKAQKTTEATSAVTQNVTETVRTEFDALLKSKDSIIQDLQEKLTVAKQLKDEATTKAKTYSSENEMIKQAMERLTSEYESKLDNMQDILNEKEESNQLLKSAYTDLKAKNENMKADAEHNQELRRELDGLTSEYNKLQTAYKELEAELKQEKVVAELKLEKTLLENERKYQEQIQKLKEEKPKVENTLSTQKNTYNELMRTYNQRLSRKNALSDMEQNMEGYGKGVRAVLGANLAADIRGVLSKLISSRI